MNEFSGIIGSLIAGVSTGLGALLIYLKKDINKETINMGLGFSAGVMLVASFVSLILPGIEEGQKIFSQNFSIVPVMLGIVIGYLFLLYSHSFIPHEHLIKGKDTKLTTKLDKVTLIILAITLHNFPEGLAVGVGFASGDAAAGMGLATAITIQNMPEGLVVAIGLLSIGASKHKAVWMAFLSGMIEPVAAVFGWMFAKVSLFTLPFALGFAGGTMIFVICQEMFPEIFSPGYEKKTSLGFIFGILGMLLIDFSF